MERLGWAYVKKARSSLDPGFYHLAEQVVFCIQSSASESSDAQLLRGHILHNLHQFKEAEVLAQELADLHLFAGDYHLAPKGKSHGDMRTDNGVLLFTRGPIAEPMLPFLQ